MSEFTHGSKHRKKILLVSNSTWNIYNFRLPIIKILLQNGFDVAVAAPVDHFIHYREQFPEVLHYDITKLHRKGFHMIRDVQLIFELINLYRHIKPDLIIHFTHKPNIFGGFASGFAKIPSISVLTGLGYAFIRNRMEQHTMKQIYKLIGMINSHFVFENNEDRMLFIEQKIIKEYKTTAVMGCGVDPHYFSPREDGKIVERLTFTYIGRLLYDKGIIEFVEAARQIKRMEKAVNFVIVGNLDKENPASVSHNELLKWIDEDVITYEGYAEDVRDWISKSDCIVLPTYREGMPKIIMEAMSMGKPVIMTDVTGCREMATDGEEVIFVRPQDAEDLKSGILNFINLDIESRISMGQKGRDRAMDLFDELNTANSFLALSTRYTTECS